MKDDTIIELHEGSPATAPDGNSLYALERLRARVHDALPGTRLPAERQLVAELGIGRRAVRRALEVLEAEGLVSRRQGAGTFAGPQETVAVAAIPSTDYLEIMEVRLRIEPHLAQLAALRARPEDVARMRAIAGRLRHYRDPDDGELWDGALHRLIAQSAGNGLFLSLFDITNRARQDAAWLAIRERARRGRDLHAHDGHDAILDAIARRDPVAAGEAMRRHLFALHEALLRQTMLEVEDMPPAGPTHRSRNTDGGSDR